MSYYEFNKEPIMTTATTRQINQITTSRIISLFVVLAWAAMVIGGPLLMAAMVHIPAGNVFLAVANIAIAAILGAPWVVFGLPVVRRFVRDL